MIPNVTVSVPPISRSMIIAWLCIIFIRRAWIAIAISISSRIELYPRFYDWWAGIMSIDLISEIYRGHQGGNSRHDLPASHRRYSFTDHFSSHYDSDRNSGCLDASRILLIGGHRIAADKLARYVMGVAVVGGRNDGDGCNRVDFKVTLTALGFGIGVSIAIDAKQKLLTIPAISEANVDLV